MPPQPLGLLIGRKERPVLNPSTEHLPWSSPESWFGETRIKYKPHLGSSSLELEGKGWENERTMAIGTVPTAQAEWRWGCPREKI